MTDFRKYPVMVNEIALKGHDDIVDLAANGANVTGTIKIMNKASNFVGFVRAFRGKSAPGPQRHRQRPRICPPPDEVCSGLPNPGKARAASANFEASAADTRVVVEITFS